MTEWKVAYSTDEVKENPSRFRPKSMTARLSNLVLTRVYAWTEVLRGSTESANLTLPADWIVFGGGPPRDSEAGAGD